MNKENRNPTSFARKAAKTAIIRSNKNPENVLNNNQNNNNNNNNKQLQNNQIDKVVESVVNATKRLSQQSNHSNSSKMKVENRVGPWRLGRTLGKGSTGRVRLAKHTVTGQLAAIKIVPKNIIDFNIDNDDNNNNSNNNENNPNSKKKKAKKPKVDENGLPYGIEREIIIMKLISHPNIMALYDVWENKNELYLVLEYVEGGELFDFLINNGKLNESDAVKYFRMIINGVSYCHKFNICHRDLKPENILLDKNGKIKIADFGMAALETQQKLLETSCGSPHYASPEIVAGKNYHGSPSDVWSCGVILFALLTGHLPFDDPNIRKLLLKVQTGKFHMPSNLSNDARDLIWSMLRINPNERIKIEDISNHPLMLKYPDDSINNGIEDKLDHLDISVPVSKIDFDILNNLKTLWNGVPESHIIKMLQNNHKNPEKMFYYLLENYKLTHANESNLPDLKHSISKTTLRVSSYTNNNNTSSDNSTNNSNRNSSRTTKPLPNSTSTVITTIYDKDGEVLKSESQEIKPINTLKKKKSSNTNLRIVASTSYNKSISFQKIRRDTSASTLSIVNMSRNLSILPDSNHYLPRDRQSSVKLNKHIDQISPSKSYTMNPKDLPELLDLNDYKYLVNSIFDSKYSNKDLTNNKTNDDKPDNKKLKEKSRVEDDIIILDIADSTDDPTDNSTSMDTSYISSRVDTTAEDTAPMSKLEKLRNDLGITNNNPQNNYRNFSSLKSVRSSSTRRLNTFLQEEYKNVKLNDFSSIHANSTVNTHRTQPSVTYSHKTQKSITLSNYSLHSAVEVKMMSPTLEELRQMNEGRVFEDADESKKNLNLISTENFSTIHKNIIPNVNINENRKSEIRNSLLTESTNDVVQIEPKINEHTSNDTNEPANSVFADAEEYPNLTSELQDTFDTEITGSLYTSLEEQPHESENKSGEKLVKGNDKGIRLSMKPAIYDEADKTKYIRHAPTSPNPHPFRAAINENLNVVDCTVGSQKQTNNAEPKLQTNNYVESQHVKPAKKTNWFKKVFAALNKKSQRTDKQINDNTKKNKNRSSSIPNKSKAQRASTFFNNISSLKFNRATYKGNTNSLFNTEYLIDSDIVTKDALVEKIHEDSRTQILKLVKTESAPSGHNYIFEVSNLDTKFAVNIIEKVGSEYGFGGCYIKLVKLKGNKKSFDYWCTIINNIILELEKMEQL